MGKYLLDLKKKKTVYLFDSKDKTFSKTSKTRIDPETSLSRKEDVFFSFQNSTEIPPPECESGKCAVFNQYLGKWEVKPDIRHKVFWNKKTLEKYEPKRFDEVISEDLTEIPPLSPYHIWDAKEDSWVYKKIEQHIADKLSIFRQMTSEKMEQSFTHNGKDWFPADLKKINYNDLMLHAMNCSRLSTSLDTSKDTWTPIKIMDSAKEPIELNLEAFIALYETYFERNLTIEQKITDFEIKLFKIALDKDLKLKDKYEKIEKEVS